MQLFSCAAFSFLVDLCGCEIYSLKSAEFMKFQKNPNNFGPWGLRSGMGPQFLLWARAFYLFSKGPRPLWVGLGPKPDPALICRSGRAFGSLNYHVSDSFGPI